ncbi:ATP-NAD kinase [Salinibaculum salinum]|uniref:ATP-NAD kinase n=1 Tax=Salinibaculum salinum TaxID=3131996 RepID=UPI0030EB2058
MTREVRRVGVVGEDTERAVATLDDAGLESVVGPPGTVLDADLDVAVGVGEPSVLELAREGPTVPLLPVDAGAGLRSVPRDRLGDTATRLLTGNWETESHPLVTVDDGTRRTLALTDAMLATAEPAHISEFTVTANGERVARFRADGIVAATPAGTAGYARNAGAPVIPPGPSVLALVPIAPFATTLDHWVVPADDVRITVEREDATVEVLADGRTVGHASVGVPVELSTGGTVELVRVPESRSPFAHRGAELEKL